MNTARKKKEEENSKMIPILNMTWRVTDANTESKRKKMTHLKREKKEAW